MRPDPGRDLQEALIAKMPLRQRLEIMEQLRATGLAILWQQSDAAPPMTELDRAMFILDRLYPDMRPQLRAQVDAKLRAEWEAGRWLGFRRPPPLLVDTDRDQSLSSSTLIDDATDVVA
jgi:hypothetical protein